MYYWILLKEISELGKLIGKSTIGMEVIIISVLQTAGFNNAEPLVFMQFSFCLFFFFNRCGCLKGALSKHCGEEKVGMQISLSLWGQTR